MSQTDPIFKLPQPAFFAHRGGAAEAPESTIEAFLYALDCGANVIEVDIQLAKDGEPMVWHGPELNITVHEDGLCMDDEFVSCWDSKDLKSKLWVRHPSETGESLEARFCEKRRIISLKKLVDFVKEVKDGEFGPAYKEREIHLNLELKKISRAGDCDCKLSWTEEEVTNGEVDYPYLRKVINILNGAPEGVTIVAGSVNHKIVSCLREIKNEKQKTNVSFWEQAPYLGLFDPAAIMWIGEPLDFLLKPLFRAGGWLFGLAIKKDKELSDRAFETPSSLVTPELVKDIHGRKGGLYVFLSPFKPLKQPEKDYSSEKYGAYRDRIKDLLDWGVDGLMTDHPSELNKALKELGYPR